ncbi:creatininase family protein [Caldithrix abyssi]
MNNILFYEALTDEQITHLEKEKVVVLLPISLLEAHGPHLPLGTDILIAEKFSQLLAQKLSKKHEDSAFLILPPVPMGVGGISRPGTLNHEQNLIKNVIFQYGQRLHEHGFKQGIIISGHAGRGHLQAMSAASRKLKRQFGFEFLALTSYLFMDAGLKKMGQMVAKEGNHLPQYDGHAGLWETSVMMYLHPDQINGKHHGLPISEDADSNGYRGNPAKASPQIGQKLVNFLLDIAQMIVEKHFWLKS